MPSAEFARPQEPVAAAALAVLAASGALVCLKEAQTGRYLWANEGYLAFLGVSAEHLAGRTDTDLLPPAEATEVRAGDLRALAAAEPAAGEHRFERDGRRLLMRTWRTVLPGDAARLLCAWWDETDAQQQAAGMQALLAQVERQQVALDQLARQQREGRDRPTELFRSEQFEDHLRREFALSMREHREFALALLAIDSPQPLRERVGAAGLAQVANAIAHLLRANTRAMDVISVLDDARFAVLLSGVGLATAHTRIEQLRRQCATHVVVHEGQPVSFSISGGVASFPHTSASLEGLSDAAEQALTHAAQSGNRVTLAPIPLGPRPAA